MFEEMVGHWAVSHCGRRALSLAVVQIALVWFKQCCSRRVFANHLSQTDVRRAPCTWFLLPLCQPLSLIKSSVRVGLAFQGSFFASLESRDRRDGTEGKGSVGAEDSPNPASFASVPLGSGL